MLEEEPWIALPRLPLLFLHENLWVLSIGLQQWLHLHLTSLLGKGPVSGLIRTICPVPCDLERDHISSLPGTVFVKVKAWERESSDSIPEPELEHSRPLLYPKTLVKFKAIESDEVGEKGSIVPTRFY